MRPRALVIGRAEIQVQILELKELSCEYRVCPEVRCLPRRPVLAANHPEGTLLMFFSEAGPRTRPPPTPLQLFWAISYQPIGKGGRAMGKNGREAACFEHALHPRHCAPGTVLAASNASLACLPTQSWCRYCPSEDTGVELPHVWACPGPQPKALGSGSWLVPHQRGEAFSHQPTFHGHEGAWTLRGPSAGWWALLICLGA